MSDLRRCKAGACRPQRYGGLLFLVLWQAMPVGTYTDEAGRTRVGFGFGAAQFENISFDCSGNPTNVERGRSTMAGVQLETFIDPQWRISASVGGANDSYLTRRDSGLRFAGSAMVAHEGSRAAFGGGVAVLPRRPAAAPYDSYYDPYFDPAYGYPEQSSYMFLPVFHLRLGGENLHFRTDMLPPAPALGALGEMRAGVGFGSGLRRRGVNGFGGLAICHFCFNDATSSSNTSAFVELAVPVQRGFDIDMGALIGPGEENTNLGITLGGRIYLGRPVPRRVEATATPVNGAR